MLGTKLCARKASGFFLCYFLGIGFRTKRFNSSRVFNSISIYPNHFDFKEPGFNLNSLPGEAGLETRMYDIAKGPMHDVTSSEGFLLAIKGVLRLKQNALLWLGVPCNRILNMNGFFCFGVVERNTFLIRQCPQRLGKKNLLIHDVVWFLIKGYLCSTKLDMDQQINYQTELPELWCHG